MVGAASSYSTHASVKDGEEAEEEHRVPSPLHAQHSSAAAGGNKLEGTAARSGSDDNDASSQVPVAESADNEVVPPKREGPVVTYLRRLRGAGQPGPSFWAPSWDGIPAFLFTAITLEVLAVIEAFGLQPYNLGLLSYLPSFGASCCMTFCLLTAPGAQPRALILTHIFGAFFGVSWAHITSNLPKPLSQQIACAFAVGMMTALMMLFGALQPSASATTCLAAFHLYGQMKDKGFMFMVTPATLGPCVIVFLAVVLNNIIPWRHCYPVWW